MSNETNKVALFVESSFLAPILDIKGVTDISYNGESLFYATSQYGRKRSGIMVNPEQVGAFLRQIANMCEKQFSYMSPVLDVTFSRYRLNASFGSIVRVYEQKSYSFSMRIARDGSAVSDDDRFFPGKTRKILLEALANKESIVIAGQTGAGKTELQKYLLLNMKPATRVIVIDNIGELERARGDGLIDLTFWMVDERYPDSSYVGLVKNALRNNPDYLIVAETRGGEMYAALGAVMSGHPIITTLHAKDIHSIPYRMARMAQLNDAHLVFDDLIGDIYHHFGLMVYVSVDEKNGALRRRITALGRVDEKTRSIKMLYEEGKPGRKKKVE